MSSIVTSMIKVFRNQADDREAILRGAAELLREGHAPLTRLTIAMRAGVSPRSVSKNFREPRCPRSRGQATQSARLNSRTSACSLAPTLVHSLRSTSGRHEDADNRNRSNAHNGRDVRIRVVPMADELAPTDEATNFGNS